MKLFGKVLGTAVASILIALTLVVLLVVNMLLPSYGVMLRNLLGFQDSFTTTADTSGLDLEYNKLGYTKEELAVAERALNEEITGEGLVLLKNEEGNMPFAEGTAFSFFSSASVDFKGGGMMGLGATSNIKDSFTAAGFEVNETLWKFYESGNGKDYGLASGAIGFGDAEDFAINECPLSVLEAEAGLTDSYAGTTAVFVWARKAGEGRDLPRSMYNHTDIAADRTKSYLEPDSVELELLTYLNTHFDDVVLLVNTAAAMELDWTAEYENIHSIVYAPSVGSFGMNALAQIFKGEINPSGRTADTFAADAMSAPAATNYGDFQYYNQDGTPTKYHYVGYKEGIYVGYKYYETRYEDVVLGQGNAGDYDYTSAVVYPFGYGLSYTDFKWGNFTTSWSGTTCTVTVDVTNTGAVAGKDVVEVYAQTPYTEYDKQYRVEKAAAQLVGYAKTRLLEPGAAEKITVTFEQDQLKAYDYTNAKTYILDAGDYLITAAADAHQAVNNILSYKGKTVADGMTAAGDAALVNLYTPSNTDTDLVTYAADRLTGAAITNQFDHANGGYRYLSRSDWQATWPTTDGEISDMISTWGNEINGADAAGAPASYTYKKTITAAELAKLDSTDSLSPVDPATLTDEIVYNAQNGVELIDLRGKDFDDPLWEDLLDNLSPEDYQHFITQSGYGTDELKAIDKPIGLDADAATGLIYGGTGMSYMGMIVLAQTWNPVLAERYGEMIGNEALVGGADGWYAPAMNIHRMPFSGRNNEYYSEDGFLSGVVGAGASRGAASKGMYIFIKHFALNDQENHRGDRDGQFGVATWSNEQAIREIYLKPFEMCVENDPITLNYLESDGNGGYSNASREIAPITAMMTSFNRVGYTWAGGNYNLITNMLRNEWGFHGFIITDNANTSLFMDGYQMIEAGADGKLTYEKNSARYTFDKTNVAEYHYGRRALHNILYTITNSKAMIGASHGSDYHLGMSTYQKIVLAANVISVVVIALLVFFIVCLFRKKKKGKAQKSA